VERSGTPGIGPHKSRSPAGATRRHARVAPSGLRYSRSAVPGLRSRCSLHPGLFPDAPLGRQKTPAAIEDFDRAAGRLPGRNPRRVGLSCRPNGASGNSPGWSAAEPRVPGHTRAVAPQGRPDVTHGSLLRGYGCSRSAVPGLRSLRSLHPGLFPDAPLGQQKTPAAIEDFDRVTGRLLCRNPRRGGSSCRLDWYVVPNCNGILESNSSPGRVVLPPQRGVRE
jgi:hypothetical protein